MERSRPPRPRSNAGGGTPGDSDSGSSTQAQTSSSSASGQITPNTSPPTTATNFRMGVFLDQLHPRHLVVFAAILFIVLFFTVVGFRLKAILKKSQNPNEGYTSKPHIVFILADDLGYNDVSYHGSEIRTPYIDELSGRGIRLENYYVQQVCSPSRSQLMTGRYQIHTGLQHSYIAPPQPNCMPTNLPTLPEKLREAGYATHLVGKWHLGFYKNECLPLNRGFDSFYGILTGRADHYQHNNSQDIESMGVRMDGYDFRDGDSVDYSAAGQYNMDLYNKRVQRIIARHDETKPLFLYIPYQAIHRPLQAPCEYMARVQHIVSEDRRTVAAMAGTIDDSVRKIVNELRKYDMWDNTVLVFSSDNGGQVNYGNNWPLRGHKNTLWEGGIRVVGFVVSNLLPSSVRGTVSRQLMDMSDWLPTLVGGVAKHRLGDLALDGYNMWDSLRYSTLSPRGEILHNIDPWPDNPSEFNVNITAAIRVGDWKLLTGDPGGEGGRWIPPPNSSITEPEIPYKDGAPNIWLFNITGDPYEKVDLSSQHLDVVDELIGKLSGYYKGAVAVRYPERSLLSDPARHGGVWGPFDPAG